MLNIVEVSHLSKRYNAFKALNDVSFSIRRGEVVGLLGPNGAGKSTTMRILAGFISATSGNARVGGFDVLTHPRQISNLIGYLPESAPVYPDMSVSAYLRFVGNIRGLGSAELSHAIDKFSNQCGIIDHLNHPVWTLSKGYTQRVGLASTLLHEPELLILDEPTNGLDPNQIAEIRDLIRHIGQTRTVILSTHILSEVQVTCDRVIIINQGELIIDDSTEAVLAQGGGSKQIMLGLAQGKVKTSDTEIIQQLNQLEGVTSVTSVAPIDHFQRFAIQTTSDCREAVFRWAVREGLIIVELTTSGSDLEEVFRRLTSDVEAA